MMLKKVTGDKSPSLRQWVFGAVLTVCLTVPSTVFAIEMGSDVDMGSDMVELITRGQKAGITCVAQTKLNGGDEGHCQKCVEGKCTKAGKAAAIEQCLKQGYSACFAVMTPDFEDHVIPDIAPGGERLLP